jgi:NADPH:quinone reductase-like Zn-dependent oxidoreductase
MKAVVMHEYGGPDVLKYEDYPDPEAGAGELLIKTAAAGINPVDTRYRQGATQDWRTLQLPAIIGWDISGTIAKIGAGVNGFSLGDRVCAWADHTYAELCSVGAGLLARVPVSMDLVSAAAVPLVSLTGSQLITVASGLQKGQTVVVSGAQGGVGRSAVFAAKELGATVIAGVLKKQLGLAKDIGADRLVALDDAPDFASIENVDVVANCVRGATAQQLMGKIKPGGTFASVTGPPGNESDYPTICIAAFKSKPNAQQLEHLVQAVNNGRLIIPIERTMPFKDAAMAHAAVEAGGTGKILLTPH